MQRQIRNIEQEYPSAIVVQEADSGTKLDHKEWEKLFGMVKEGDTIVFDSVIRMSRNAEDGFAVYAELFRRGVSLIFLKEHHIDTSTYKKAMESSVPLAGASSDGILQGFRRFWSRSGLHLIGKKRKRRICASAYGRAYRRPA